MKANELRIGNYILFCPIWKGKVQSERVVMVVEITINSIIFIEKDGEQLAIKISSYEIKPIPLTTEILLNLGFKNGCPYSSHYGFTSKCGDFFFEKSYHLKEISSGQPISIEIKYLHQLQNLYFALTGEELELKQLNTPHTGQSNAV